MRRRLSARTFRMVPVAAALAGCVALSGCGLLLNRSDDPSGGSSDASSSATGASDLKGVEAATIQVVAEGTFVDPELGEQTNSAGAGSGFIIDPEGIAVTNNHVVTGSAFLQVYVGGEPDPVNARVLGVSECSDLAVIDLEGGGFPTLNWSDEEPDTGLEVYAAGFPLGDPEFTLTRGIISKAAAEGETNWASLDGVLEHDATINPGNSGGPLVDASGGVVGINYAGNPETRQQYAIAQTEARKIVESLRAEEDVTSLGLNGEAVLGEDGTSGIWVASVESGSPADDAGIKGGDIITRLENIQVATDGTMSEYCDVLRSHTDTDVLQVQVLRYATSQVLEGQFNGDPLEEVTSFAQELGGTEGGGETYSGYTTISDDTGAISVDVPTEWTDVDTVPFTLDDGIAMVEVRASTDIEAFHAGWDTPGIIVTASSGLAQAWTVDTVADQLGSGVSEKCTYEGRQPYTDQLYTGVYDVFSNCGGTGATYVIVAAQPEDGSFIVSVEFQANTDRDFDALDQVLATFMVTGTV